MSPSSSQRRARASMAANPVLVGAVTTLIVVVAVFLAYNANSGLPFVPTYQVNVRLTDATELVVGNDVRKGGRRIGQVSELTAVRTPEGAYAIAQLQLEKDAGPLPADSAGVVRARSALGLKYLELIPGRSMRTIADGGELRNRGTTAAVDLDDLLGTFDGPTRQGIDELLGGAGPGLAGRGGDLNRALEALPATLGVLSPVMRNLADTRTDLPGFLRAGNTAMAAVQPILPQLGPFLDDAATTFTALDDPAAIDATLRSAAANFGPIARELRTARPQIASARRLLTDLRPALRALPGTSRTFGAALDRTAPALVRTRPTLVAARPTIEQVRTTLRFPATSTALRQLSALAETTVPTLTYINPLQTRCNYLGLWFRNVVSFISEGDDLGTWFRALPVIQPEEILPRATPAPELHYDPYPAAGQDGTCSAGNTVYEPGQKIGRTGQTAPGTTEPTGRPGGL